MKTNSRLSAIVACVIFLQTMVSAQKIPAPSQDATERQTSIEQRDIQQRADKNLYEREKALRSPKMTEREAAATSRVLSKEEKERIAGREAEMRANSALIAKMSAVSPKYYKKYEKLLKDKRFDLFRIFPEKRCYQGKLVSAQEMERCSDIPPVEGGGSYYSFRLKSNSFINEGWWDMHFANNKFTVGNDTVQAIISEIGKTNIEDIKLDSEAFKFLTEYKPLNKISKIREESAILERGISSNGFIYSNIAQLKPDSTYVARIIAYQLKKQPKYLKPIEFQGRGLDVVLAFKVVGVENDGSLIIIWKKLKNDSPTKKIT